MKTVNVAIIGTKFMGKAHSNAWTSAPKFFKLGLKPVLKLACGQDPAGTGDFASNWGWEETASDRAAARAATTVNKLESRFLSAFILCFLQDLD